MELLIELIAVLSLVGVGTYVAVRLRRRIDILEETLRRVPDDLQPVLLEDQGQRLTKAIEDYEVIARKRLKEVREEILPSKVLRDKDIEAMR